MPRPRRASAAAAGPRIIPRKIHFYDMELSSVDDEERTEIRDYPPLFSHILSLPFQPSGPPNASRYMAQMDNNLIAIQDIQTRGGHIQGVIGTIRRDALPDIETLGQLEPLSLPQQAGLFEATHFVLFSAERILGMEFNLYGPRTGRLAQYLMEKCPDVQDARFTQILREDIQQRLRQVGEVSVMRLAVQRDGVATTRLLNQGLPGALQAVEQTAAQGEADIVEVVLRARRRQRFPLPFTPQRIMNFLRNRDARDATVAFQVKAQNTQTEQLEMFDLLEDRLIFSASVQLSGQRSRSVDHDSMFGAIERVFAEHRADLIARRGPE